MGVIDFLFFRTSFANLTSKNSWIERISNRKSSALDTSDLTLDYMTIKIRLRLNIYCPENMPGQATRLVMNLTSFQCWSIKCATHYNLFEFKLIFINSYAVTTCWLDETLGTLWDLSIFLPVSPFEYLLNLLQGCFELFQLWERTIWKSNEWSLYYSWPHNINMKNSFNAGSFLAFFWTSIETRMPYCRHFAWIGFFSWYLQKFHLWRLMIFHTPISRKKSKGFHMVM